MLFLRPVRESDLDDLFELSKLYVFINLPSEKEIIRSKIKHSINTFQNPSHDLSLNHYIFVLEDSAADKVVGCSMIHAQHGTEEEPHFFLTQLEELSNSTTHEAGSKLGAGNSTTNTRICEF